MNDYNPFNLIAAGFPYKTPVSLSKDDMPHLVLSLLEDIADKSTRMTADKYGMIAARHFVYLDLDYGTEYAAAYFESLRKIPKIHLNEAFFKYAKVQKVIRDIFLKDGPITNSDQDKPVDHEFLN